MNDLENFLNCGTIVTSSRGRVLIGWGERKWLEKPHETLHVSYYFPDYFFQDSHPWFVHETSMEVDVAELLHCLDTDAEGKAPQTQWENNTKDNFNIAFNELQSLFDVGILKKGVPFIFETSKTKLLPENIPFLLKNTLNYTQKNPVHIYGFWDKNQGMLGATPEILFNLTTKEGKSKLETVACAGTCPKEKADFFLSDTKQLHEHYLVVDGIIESLRPFGEVSRDSVDVLRLPNLCHLITPIKLIKDGFLNAEEIVKAIHPTPALGAFPKAPGMVWLKKYQNQIDRKRFGAPVGFRFSDGNCFCYVAIRNVQWTADQLNIGAGCGVVPQSEIEKEWEEVKLKIKSIKNILGL